MSYTVLARKWRPKNFSELVGQQHVMQALSNALDQQRLHHAYLFTGTRGVGKTTIARIFAKALNCEQGITSKPCGQCATCRSIDEGRFVDLIEVDAASKTKVEDTRELLENVQYAPVQGRFKVYLIDEVHMLSKSSFNALLKTLEEPPEHVKFLLATTDPHKLPITVLSRCLQFNLMRLTPTQIQNHLAYILQQEQVPFEESALSMISKSADGSARDSLSILDQAIAYGGGQVMFEPVQAMLGLVDQQFVLKILTALLNQAPQEIKVVMQELSQMGVDYEALNHQLIEVFHQLSLLQVLGALNDVAVVDEAFLQQVAKSLSPEKVQVLYQVALLAQQDMRLAPDVRIGFEMALLRMLVFEPGSSSSSGVSENGDRAGVSAPQVMPTMTGGEVAQERPSNAVPAQQMQAEPLNELEETKVVSHQPLTDVLPSQQSEKVGESGANQQQTESTTSLQQDKDAQHLMSLKEKISQSLGKLQANNSEANSSESSKVSQQKIVSESPSRSVDSSLQERGAIPSPSSTEDSRVGDFNHTPVSQEANAPMGDSKPVANDQGEVSAVTSFSEDAPSFDNVPLEAYEDSFHAVDVTVSVDETGEVFAQSPHQESKTATFQAEVAAVQSQEEPVDPEVSKESIEALPDEAASVEEWVRLIQGLNLDGWAGELANQSMLVSYGQQKLVLSVDPTQLPAKSDLAVSRLHEVVQQKLGATLTFVEASGEHVTPAKYWQHQKQLQKEDAVQSIYQDPSVQGFVEILNMRVIDSSIQSLGKQ